MNDIFDECANNYSGEIDKALGKFGTSHDFFTVHKAWLIQELLIKHQHDAGQIDLLDVGCGVGKIHQYLEADFKSISGVDISKQSLKVARETCPDIDYRDYDGRHIPFDDGSVDVTIAICVFHHVPVDQWEELAGEMLRVLRPGGMSLIIEHNPYNPITRRIVNNCPFDEGAVLLRPARLRKIFSDAGGKDIHTNTILSVPPKNKFLKKLDIMLGALPLGAQYFMIAQKP